MGSEVFIVERQSGRRIDLDGKMTIGRGDGCDIQIQGRGISRSHGLFEVSDGNLIFTDLGSSNGSFVNGYKLTKTETLYEADVLSIGDCELVVHSGIARSAESAEDDATAFISTPGQANEIPAMWSDSAGVESDSQTQFASAVTESAAAAAYRQGTIELPELGDCPRLVIITPEQRGECFSLEIGNDNPQNWNIGRDANCDVVISDASVSAQHAQLVRDGVRWKIVNWMSTNGTFVNGSKGLSTYLKHGDLIGLGKVELAFEIPKGADAAQRSNTPEKRGFFARLLDRLRGR